MEPNIGYLNTIMCLKTKHVQRPDSKKKETTNKLEDQLERIQRN